MHFLQRCFPKQPPVPVLEKLMAGLSAFISIAVLWHIKDTYPDVINNTVLASMGATAVLLFATPHSTLVQPYAILGGHFVSALIGIAAIKFVPAPYAAAVAVGAAITAMHLLHCLHPPGGATALFAVTGGPEIWNLGYGYVLAPVAVNAGLMLFMGFVIHNLRDPGKLYPSPLTPAVPLSEPIKGFQGVTSDDIKEAVSESGTYIDVTEEDLFTIYQAAEANVLRRVLQGLTVERLDLRTARTLPPGASLEEIIQSLAVSESGCVLVLDEQSRVEGIITGFDVPRALSLDPQGGNGLPIGLSVHPHASVTAESIMTHPVRTLTRTDRLDAAVDLFSTGDIHHVPVVDEQHRVLGVITHAHLWSFLNQEQQDHSPAGISS